MTQAALADALGNITPGTVAKLETGGIALNLDYMLSLARVLKVHPAEFIEQGSVPAREVPLLGSVTAGPLAEQVSQADETIAVPSDIEGQNLFALRVSGDSMDQIVPDGGVIVVNPDELDLIERKVYVVANSDHETTFKRFMLNPPRLAPCSNNAKHKPIEIGRTPFVVIGRAVFSLSPL